MNILERLSFILFHSLSFSFILFRSLSFSFILCHSLSFSVILCHSLSFSVILCHSLSFSVIFFSSCSFFLGCSKSFFCIDCHTISLGPLFSFFFLIIFIFVFFLNLFQCFSLFFPLFFLFHFLFLYFLFVFPLKKSFFLFHFVSLFSFLGCSKSVAAPQDSLEKSAHSELALFALYWFVVTFLCGIVHILLMIRLRVVYGGRRVGQSQPSCQNRQLSRRLTHLSLVSSSQFYKYLSLFSRKLVLAGRSRVFPGRLPFFPKGTMHILRKFAPRPGKKVEPPGRLS